MRPTLLFVSPCTPDQTGVGWEQRSYSLLLAYSKYLDINLWLVPTRDNPSVERVKKLGKLCKSITVFQPNLLLKNPTALARLNAVINASDCVHLYRQMGFLNIRHKCVFWDIDELPVELRDGSRNANLKPIPPESVYKVFARYSKAWKMSRRVFSCSRLEFNQALGDSYYVPNVYSTDIVERKGSAANNLIFVGNTNFYPNVDAIFYFCNNILPRLPANTSFTVVGRGPLDKSLKEKFDNLEKNNKIKFVYDVESCTPYYQKSAVAVVPINFGGGTKLKVLEAFSHCCPVVSTAKGCEGLEVTDGREVFLRDSPEEFANACRLLMENPIIGNEIAKNARNLLVSKYSQEVINDLLYTCLLEEGITRTSILS